MKTLNGVAVVLGLLAFAAIAPLPLVAQPAGAETYALGPAPPSTLVRADTLTLAQALERALASNPDLHAAQWRVEAYKADQRQAGRWPNPELEAEIDEFGGRDALTGTQSAELGVGLNQTFPLGGDLAARRRVAAEEKRLAQQRYDAVQLDVVQAVTKAFGTTLAAQYERDLAARQWALAQQFASTVADRVEAGKVSPLEATRAAIDRSTARVALEQAERSFRIARAQLSRWWGDRTPDFAGVTGDWMHRDEFPPLEVLAPHLLETPEVLHARTEVALHQAKHRLIEAERIPDPTLQMGVRRFRELGETAFQAGVSFPLPLFDRQRDARDAATARIQMVESEAEAVYLATYAQLTAQYEALQAAAFEVRILATDVLPAAEEVYEATVVGYREGKFDLLTLIDAQRTLFDASRQQVAALLIYYHRRAEVERLIGRSLDAGYPNGTSQ